jgi:hypothetical protein
VHRGKQIVTSSNPESNLQIRAENLQPERWSLAYNDVREY